MADEDAVEFTGESTVEKTGDDGEEKNQPMSIKVIGWTFVAFGALMLLTGLMGLFVFYSMRQMGIDFASMTAEMPAEMQHSFKSMSHIFDNLHIYAGLMLPVGAFILVAAVRFLQLRAWARTALEVISWLGLVYLVGSGAFWLYAMPEMATAMGHGEPHMFRMMMGAVMAVIFIVVFVLPNVVLIKFLRGQKIRDAVCR
jgi:hypothetical protein